MVNRIVVVDGVWDKDNVKFVPRTSLPITLDNVSSGEYFVTNTSTNPASGVVIDPAQVNNPPTSTAILEQVIPVGSPYALDIRNFFNDRNNDPLTFTFTGTLPTGITFTNGQFSGTPTVDGQAVSGVIRATDTGGLWVEQVINFSTNKLHTVVPELVAGEEAVLVFNAVPDSVTITQGTVSLTVNGTDETRTFTPLTTETITIGASKAGFGPFSGVFNVAPPLSVLLVRDRELVVDNEPTANRPLDIVEPVRFAMTGINIAPDQYTNGKKIIASPVIVQTDGVVTATRGGLFSWREEIEPVFFGHDYRRGATPQTATLIPNTADVDSYTTNTELDGGQNVYRRDWISSQNGLLETFSNAIAVASGAGWWINDPALLVDIDYVNNRARINGVNYNSIAAAESAGAIKTSKGLKFVDVGTVKPFTLLASGLCVRDSTKEQVLVSLDDGEDGNPSDNHYTYFVNTSAKGLVYAQTNGSVVASAQTTSSFTGGSTFTAATTARTTSPHGYFILGNETFTDTSIPFPTNISRLCLGGRSDAPNSFWQGTMKRVVLINAPKTDAELAALKGSIE